MEKFKRGERIALITKALIEQPNRQISLSYFCDRFDAAKSTISEDLAIIKEALQREKLGTLHTIAGAAGGIKYTPAVNLQEAEALLEHWCQRLADPKRIIPGGFLYMADVIFDSFVVSKVGELFAQYFSHLEIDCVITIETKGIPLATMTAKTLGVPLVIIRDNSKVTEGSSVSINYVSGSSRRISTMSLSRRALPNGAKVLIIDDFMKAGGTAKGIHELMEEFDANVVGMGVFVATSEPKQKLVQNYLSILELTVLDEEKDVIKLKPALFQ
ncbi:MAG: pur operon repressor [Bacillota bacterium]|nr:pur operon repressor [Bacillota bacterium]